jgi:hypothetical protein
MLEREEGEIPSEADVLAGVDTGSDLSNENRSGRHFLTAEDLRAASLAVAVTTVA